MRVQEVSIMEAKGRGFQDEDGFRFRTRDMSENVKNHEGSEILRFLQANK